MTKVEELRTKIEEANVAYWVHAKPIITDVEYDKLVRAYSKLCPNDPIVNSVDSDSSYGQKVKHKEKMYSLGKCYTFDDVISWASKYARDENELIDCQVKMDGLSAELVDGRLISRGNGDIGNDISHMLPYIDVWTDLNNGIRLSSNCILSAPHLRNSRIVGELLITNKRFSLARHDETVGQLYKTPRNMAAGLCNQKPETVKEFMSRFNHPIITLVSHESYSVTRPLCKLRSEIQSIASKLRGYKDLPCDGIVFKFHDREYSKSLGFTAKFPIGAIAYKFEEDQVDVLVKNIIWQTGELHVTPVAEFDPVELDGVQVNRVTLHCAKFVKERNVCVGSTLTIIRQGGVIPKVINVITPSDLRFTLPTKCSECGSDLKDDDAYLSCTNESCTARIAAKIVRGLNVFGIKGVGPALALKVVKDLMIPDIMTWFKEVRDPDLLRDKGYSASQISTLCNGADKACVVPMPAEKILRSVCIEDVGVQFADSVNKYAGGIIHLIKDTADVDSMYGKLVGKPGINLRALTNFMIWMENYRETFVDYCNLFNVIPYKTDDPLGELIGRVKALTQRTYCFTGSGPIPRSELIGMTESKGHRTTDNANQCDVLVASDPNGNSSKLKKARAKGIKIISYDEFAHDLDQ